MSDKALSAVLEAPERMVLREFDLPEVHEDDALLRVEVAGICHTDVGLYHGTTRYVLPLIMGHEIVGRIARIGALAAQLWGVREGDRVTVESKIRCGFCRACVAGNYKYCSGGLSYGTRASCSRPPHLWGSYGQYMYLAPGTLLYKVPHGVSAEVANLLTVAISNGVQWVVLRGGAKLGDAVVVQGVGSIGLCCVAAAKEAGAGPVIATGLTADRYRLELAREFGADVVVDVQAEDVVERVRDVTGGDMADVVVDVTGNGDAVRKSLELVRPLGTVVSAGVTGDATLTPLPLDTLLYKEIRLQGVFSYDTHAVRRAMTLALRGRYPFDKLVTHRFPLDQAERAVKTAGREIADEAPIKVVILPNGTPA
ncbi:MAG TPA: zinc-binding dehydrogenase [Chloroflexota bacterium]|nr:zinc-binding dehydrogenase [Chloroflexota bacterium]